MTTTNDKLRKLVDIVAKHKKDLMYQSQGSKSENFYGPGSEGVSPASPVPMPFDREALLKALRDPSNEIQKLRAQFRINSEEHLASPQQQQQQNQQLHQRQRETASKKEINKIPFSGGGSSGVSRSSPSQSFDSSLSELPSAVPGQPPFGTKPSQSTIPRKMSVNSNHDGRQAPDPHHSGETSSSSAQGGAEQTTTNQQKNGFKSASSNQSEIPLQNISLNSPSTNSTQIEQLRPNELTKRKEQKPLTSIESVKKKEPRELPLLQQTEKGSSQAYGSSPELGMSSVYSQHKEVSSDNLRTSLQQGSQPKVTRARRSSIISVGKVQDTGKRNHDEGRDRSNSNSSIISATTAAAAATIVSAAMGLSPKEKHKFIESAVAQQQQQNENQQGSGDDNNGAEGEDIVRNGDLESDITHIEPSERSRIISKFIEECYEGCFPSKGKVVTIDFRFQHRGKGNTSVYPSEDATKVIKKKTKTRLFLDAFQLEVDKKPQEDPVKVLNEVLRARSSPFSVTFSNLAKAESKKYYEGIMKIVELKENEEAQPAPLAAGTSTTALSSVPTDAATSAPARIPVSASANAPVHPDATSANKTEATPAAPFSTLITLGSASTPPRAHQNSISSSSSSSSSRSVTSLSMPQTSVPMSFHYSFDGEAGQTNAKIADMEAKMKKGIAKWKGRYTKIALELYDMEQTMRSMQQALKNVQSENENLRKKVPPRSREPTPTPSSLTPKDKNDVLLLDLQDDFEIQGLELRTARAEVSELKKKNILLSRILARKSVEVPDWVECDFPDAKRPKLV